MPAPAELPPPTDEKKVRVTCYLQPGFAEALKIEGVKRNMTLGELVEEALRTRQQATWK